MYANVYNGYATNGFAVNGRNDFERNLALVEQAYREQKMNGMDFAMNGILGFIATVAKGGVKVIKAVGSKVVGAARKVVQKVKNFKQERDLIKRQREAGQQPVGSQDIEKQKDYEQVKRVVTGSGGAEDDTGGGLSQNQKTWIIVGSSVAGLALIGGIVYATTRKRKRRR